MSKEWAFYRKIYYDTIYDLSVYLKTGSNYAPFVLRLKTSNAKSTSKKNLPCNEFHIVWYFNIPIKLGSTRSYNMTASIALNSTQLFGKVDLKTSWLKRLCNK